MLAPVSAEFPQKAAPLFRPAPFKVLYGGRGGAKSWAAARALLILGSQRKLFILCAREIQKSVRDSVYKLLVDQIAALGLGHVHEIQSNTIINTETGTQFVFAGIRNNITSIKSMEAIDVCWVEEATFVSESSWTVLLPTIRRDPPFGPFKQGSEVWVTFNPELASDYTYKYWVLNPPEGTVKILMNHQDNPWFPANLYRQMLDLKERDYDSYLTIWEGNVRRVLQGAIYAKELEKAQAEGRISPDVEWDKSKPVDVGVDLGRNDMTALWYFQQSGMLHHAIGYYGNFGYDWSHYLEDIQNRRYIIGKIYLPHDAKNETVAASKSVYRQTRDVYPGDGRVVVVPRTAKVANDINSVRLIFPRLYFNEEACSDGLTALAHYRYEVDPETKEVSKEPKHDWSSHAADGLRSYVMGLRSPTVRGPQLHAPPAPPRYEHGHGWLGR